MPKSSSESMVNGVGGDGRAAAGAILVLDLLLEDGAAASAAFLFLSWEEIVSTVGGARRRFGARGRGARFKAHEAAIRPCYQRDSGCSAAQSIKTLTMGKSMLSFTKVLVGGVSTKSCVNLLSGLKVPG